MRLLASLNLIHRLRRSPFPKGEGQVGGRFRPSWRLNAECKIRMRTETITRLTFPFGEGSWLVRTVSVRLAVACLTFPFGEGGPSQTVDEVKGGKQPHPSKRSLRPTVLPPSPLGEGSGWVRVVSVRLAVACLTFPFG